MPSLHTSPAPVRVTVVESDACHFCQEARQSLAELAQSYPIDIEVLDVRTQEGQRLMAMHRAAMSPLVLLDGEFFSQGRLPRRKLTTVLDQRPDATTALVG